MLRLNCPHPRSGGQEMRAVMLQMVMMVMRVESGVDSGNCRSFVTIMNRCSANTVSEMIDWIPAVKHVIRKLKHFEILSIHSVKYS